MSSRDLKPPFYGNPPSWVIQYKATDGTLSWRAMDGLWTRDKARAEVYRDWFDAATSLRKLYGALDGISVVEFNDDRIDVV